MTFKESILTQYAYTRIQWLMSLARNVWSLTITIAGVSFLAGYYLSQNSVLLSVIECFLVAVLMFTLYNLVRSFRKDRDSGEAELFRAACAHVVKEASQDESTSND